MTGLQPSDVESVSIGMGDPQGIAALPGLMGQPIASSRALTVIRSKKPLVPEEWLSQQTDFKPAEHNSKKYFESSNSGYAAWIAEPTTLLMAGSSELKAAMDRGETVIPRKELLFMDPTPHVVVIGAPKNPRSAAGLPIPLPDSNPGLKSVQSALGESMTAFGLGLNIRGGFDVLTSFAVRHPPDADAVKSGLNASLAEGKKALQDAKSKLPPLLMELGESLISNVRIEAHSQIVSFNTGLPDSDQQKIEQVPTVVMSMLVLGGLAADGNPFGSSGDPLLMAGLGPEAAQLGVKPDTTTSSGSRRQVMGLDWSLDANGQTQYWAIAATTAPESTSGMIDNTSLTAKSACAMSVPQGTRAVRVLIDLQGDGLSAICGYGQVTVSEITCKGSRAKVKPEEVMPRQILGQVLFPFDPADGASNDSPPGTLRLAIPVELPDATASALEKLEGTFKVLTCDGREQYMIDDAVKTAKRPLNIPGLKGAGVKLSYPIGGESLTVSWAPEYFLSQIRITAPADSIGPGMKNRFDWELEKNKPQQKLYARSYPGGRIPDKLQLQFNVCRGVKEKTVAFKFSNIALPAPEAFAPDAGWLIEGPRPGLDSSRPK